MAFLAELQSRVPPQPALEDSNAPVTASTTPARATSATDPRFEKVKCPRCERLVFAFDMESHSTAHSTQVLSHVFLGGERNASNLIELTTRTGVSRVLNVAWEVANCFPDQFQYLKVPIPDDGKTDISTFLPECFSFLDDAEAKGERVLVHCVQGISRSATVVVAYLMSRNRWDATTALSFVQQLRPIVRPHGGFLEQLTSERFMLSLPMPPATLALTDGDASAPAVTATATAAADITATAAAAAAAGSTEEGTTAVGAVTEH